MNSALSVIIPAYNVEKYISKTLESLKNQTLRSIEIIIVNDGSTDDTRNVVINTLAGTDLEWKLIDQENKGVSVARNIGLEIANGEYVHFLDGDDYVDSTFSEKLYQKAKCYNCDIVFCIFDQVSSDGKLLHSYDKFFISKVLKKIETKPSEGQFVLKQYLNSKLHIWTGNAIYKREFLLKEGLRYTPGCGNGEDVEFIVKAILKSERIMFVPELLSFYLMRESSVTRSTTLSIRKRCETLYGVYECVNSFIESSTNNKELLRLWKRKIGSYFLEFLKAAVVLDEHIDLDNEFLSYLRLAKKAHSKEFNDNVLKVMLRMLPPDVVMKILYWYGSFRRK